MTQNTDTQPQIGLQLWTVRDALAQDFAGTLERVAALGLAGVEFAGYGGLSASDLRDLLARLNLQAAASHVAYERLFSQLDEELRYAAELGLTRLVCPWARFEQDAEWLSFADRLEQVAQECANAGVSLSYHNHAHELQDRLGGERVLAALLSRAPTVQAELDVAWLQAGGASAPEYLRRYAGRTDLVHLKDYRAGQGGPREDGVVTVALGDGVTDLEGVLTALREANARGAGPAWLLIEQDDSEGNSFDSVARSLAWLRAHLPTGS